MTAIAAGLALSVELRAVEAEFTGWHVWLSDEGRVWATHVLTRAETIAIERRYRSFSGSLNVGAGVTLDAPTPALMRCEIAQYVALTARAA